MIARSYESAMVIGLFVGVGGVVGVGLVCDEARGKTTTTTTKNKYSHTSEEYYSKLMNLIIFVRIIFYQ